MAQTRIDARMAGRPRSLAATVAILVICTAMPLNAQSPGTESALAQLEQQAEANVRAAALRAEVARLSHENGRNAYAAGTISFADYLALQVSAAQAEQALVLARLDADEIAASGGAIRYEFTAPQVAGRDFIGARLQAELDAASERLGELEVRLDYARARVDAGVETPLGLIGVEVEYTQLAVDVDRLRDSIALRKQFLAGDVSAEEAEIRYQLLAATARLEIADIGLSRQREVDALMEVRYRAGTAPFEERNASANALLALEFDAQQAEFDVERFRRALALTQPE